jgi:hypothetical protein
MKSKEEIKPPFSIVVCLFPVTTFAYHFKMIKEITKPPSGRFLGKKAAGFQRK